MPAIVYCRPLPGREADFGSGKDRRMRRSWLAMTDTRQYSEGLLLADAMAFGASPPVPAPFITPHPDDPTFMCKRLRGKQEKNSPLHWIIDAEYDTAPFNDEDEEEENPLDRRAKFSWSTVTYQKAIERSRNGNAILNSAGDYFDPPPLKDVDRWTVDVTKNISSVPTGILNWRNKINSDEFVIDGVSIGVNVARIKAIRIGDIQEDQGVEYRVLQYTLEFDEEDEWEGVYLNQGFYGLVAGVKQRIQVNGRDAVSPQLLTDAGVYIVNPEPSDASYEHYDIYDEMTFNGNLPLT